MRRLAAAVLLPVLALSACGGQGGGGGPAGHGKTVLARWQGGSLSQQEFALLFRVRFGPSAPAAAADPRFEEFELRRTVFGRLAPLARPSLRRDPAFLRRALLADRQAALQAYDASRPAGGTRPVRLVELQFTVLLDPFGHRHRRGEALRLARRLNALHDPHAIDRLVSRTTERPAFRPGAGLLPPQCAACAQAQAPFLADALRHAPAGRFVVVEHPAGHWIGRVVARPVVAPAALHDYFARFFARQAAFVRGYAAGMPPARRSRVESAFAMTPAAIDRQAADFTRQVVADDAQARADAHVAALARARHARLLPAGRWEDPVAPRGGYRPGTVLFTIDGHRLTWGALARRFPAPTYGRTERFDAVRILWLDGVLRADPAYRAVWGGRLFRAFRRARLDNAYADAWLERSVPQPRISEAAIRARFAAERNGPLRGVTFTDARPRIRAALVSEAQLPAEQRAEDALARRFGLRLYSANLPRGI